LPDRNICGIESTRRIFTGGLARAGCGELTFLPANHKAAVLANTALNLFGSQEP